MNASKDKNKILASENSRRTFVKKVAAGSTGGIAAARKCS